MQDRQLGGPLLWGLWILLIIICHSGVGSQDCDPETESCECNVTFFEVDSTHAGPKKLTEIIPFIVNASWTPNEKLEMKVFADSKLVETKSVDANNSKICGDNVLHTFYVQNFGPNDGKMQGYPVLKVLTYLVIPDMEVPDVTCGNITLCHEASILYHFTPAENHITFESYPKHPKLGQYMNLTCHTVDANPPVVNYYIHMYDYEMESELFSAQLSSVTFQNAKPGRYRCSVVNYPFGKRHKTLSKIISVKHIRKVIRETTTTILRTRTEKTHKLNITMAVKTNTQVDQSVVAQSLVPLDHVTRKLPIIRPIRVEALMNDTAEEMKTENETKKMMTTTMATPMKTKSPKMASGGATTYPVSLIILCLSLATWFII